MHKTREAIDEQQRQLTEAKYEKRLVSRVLYPIYRRKEHPNGFTNYKKDRIDLLDTLERLERQFMQLMECNYENIEKHLSSHENTIKEVGKKNNELTKENQALVNENYELKTIIRSMDKLILEEHENTRVLHKEE